MPDRAREAQPARAAFDPPWRPAGLGETNPPWLVRLCVAGYRAGVASSRSAPSRPHMNGVRHLPTPNLWPSGLILGDVAGVV